MIMPFLLRRLLAISHIKDSELGLLQIRLTDSTNLRPKIPLPSQIINTLISCWVAIAKASCLCFSITFTEQTYKELKKL